MDAIFIIEWRRKFILTPNDNNMGKLNFLVKISQRIKIYLPQTVIYFFRELLTESFIRAIISCQLSSGLYR